HRGLARRGDARSAFRCPRAVCLPGGRPARRGHYGPAGADRARVPRRTVEKAEPLARIKASALRGNSARRRISLGPCPRREPRISLPSLSSLLEIPSLVFSYVAGKLVQIFVLPGTFSLASLLSALMIATLFLGLKRQRRRKPLQGRVLLRAVFPKR